MTYDNIPGSVVIRYDLVAELASLLDVYRTKREEIEMFLGEGEDPFGAREMLNIAGIAVSAEAVKVGLQAELAAMELKLENRFNIVIGRPLPVAAPIVYESADDAAVEDDAAAAREAADLESEATRA
jgi:hypothetical protein